MLRHLFALSLLAAPAAAVTATLAPAPAQADESSDWGLAAMPNGCMVQAVSPAGTMLSI